MAKRSKRTYTAEDSAEITRATNEALQEYTERAAPVRVSDLLMEFGGSASALARELTGIGPGKLPAKGTPQRTEYENQKRYIGRYLAYESGSSKQKRNPNTPETQARLKKIQMKRRPPTSMSITVFGEIGYDDDDRRPRTISVTLPNNGATPQRFLEYMQRGNTSEAYQEVFQAYKVGRGVLTVSDENPEIHIEFSGGDEDYEE